MSTKLQEYHVENPEGKTIKFNAPVGISDDEIIRRATQIDKAQKNVARENAKPLPKAPTFRDEFNRHLDETVNPILGGVVGGMYGGPWGAASVSAAMDALYKYQLAEESGQTMTASARAPFIDVELPDTGSNLANAIIDTGVNTLTNFGTGKIIEKGMKGARAVGNLAMGVDAGVPKDFLKLKPTYAQLSGSKFAEAVENLATPELKKEAIDNSIRIARTQAEELTQNLRKTSKPQSFGNIDDIVEETRRKTQRAYEVSTINSELHAGAAKDKAAQVVQQYTKPGPVLGTLPNGQPLTGPPVIQNIEGPIDMQKTINKLLQIRDDIVSSTKTPDPNNPLLRDIDHFLSTVDYDPTGKLQPRPLSFKEAWESKVAYGKAGYEGVDVNGRTIKDVNYQRIHDAISDDIQTSLGSHSPDALKEYELANKMIRDRHSLFDESASKKMVNLTNDPDMKSNKMIDEILNDHVKLKKFLNQNKTFLPDGTEVVSLNKRNDLKAYKFMSMFDDNFKLADPNDLTAGKLNSDSLTNEWNKFKVSKEGKLLYNNIDRDNIDTFISNLDKVNQRVGGEGANKYLAVRFGTGMFRLGASTTAAFLAGSGGNVPVAGTVGLASIGGLILGSRQIGKILTNPDAALILNKMALNKPLGRSMRSAAQILAYALRNETINAEDTGGNPTQIKLDATGKVTQ